MNVANSVFSRNVLSRGNVQKTLVSPLSILFYSATWLLIDYTVSSLLILCSLIELLTNFFCSAYIFRTCMGEVDMLITFLVQILFCYNTFVPANNSLIRWNLQRISLLDCKIEGNIFRNRKKISMQQLHGWLVFLYLLFVVPVRFPLYLSNTVHLYSHVFSR